MHSTVYLLCQVIDLSLPGFQLDLQRLHLIFQLLLARGILLDRISDAVRVHSSDRLTDASFSATGTYLLLLVGRLLRGTIDDGAVALAAMITGHIRSCE